MKSFIITLLLISALTSNAQLAEPRGQLFSISGIVINEKGETLPGATVFISNSKKLTSTNDKGEFILTQISSGENELVVKTLGYEPFIQIITFKNNLKELRIVLKESTISLNTVVIKAPPDPNRPKYLKIFKEFFIGYSVNAAKCTIINPDILRFRFNKQDSVFEVSADDILSIENQALGYRINYVIKQFRLDYKKGSLDYQGSPYFEDLKGSSEQQAGWEKNREAAYQGSVRHFFKAAFNNRTETEGFSVYNLPDPKILKKLSKKDLAEITPVKISSFVSEADNGLKSLNHFDKTSATDRFIVYSREQEPPEFTNSGLKLNFPLKFPAKLAPQVSQFSTSFPVDLVLFDSNGVLNKGKSFSYKGYWAWERVADLVPVDYISLLDK